MRFGVTKTNKLDYRSSTVPAANVKIKHFVTGCQVLRYGMPKCKHESTAVVESRFNQVHQGIVRRRRCYECPERFSTIEIPLEDYVIYQKIVGKIDELAVLVNPDSLTVVMQEPG